MADNKDQSHIVALPKEGRTDLEDLVLSNIFDNDNELITPFLVREVLVGFVNSTANLLDDNIDNRFDKVESFGLADLSVFANHFEYVLQEVPVNDFTLFIEGLEQREGTDYVIVAPQTLRIFKDEEVEVDSDFTFEVKYRFLD